VRAAFLLSEITGLPIKIGGSHVVLLDPDPLGIHHAQIVATLRIATVTGLPVEVSGANVILLESGSRSVHHGKIVATLRIAAMAKEAELARTKQLLVDFELHSPKQAESTQAQDESPPPLPDATVTLGGTSLLERVGALLHGFRYQSIEVAGHTDNTPLRNDLRKNFRDNLELSRTRAEHAVQVLINGGLEAKRVKAVGHADSKPIATNDTEKGRSKNQRMEIMITQASESGHTLGGAEKRKSVRNSRMLLSNGDPTLAVRN
jgi:outer membrane protein OmpA-like peptidoglycan-associated protein